MDKVLKSYLEHICGKENVEENADMRARTTIKIGGRARFFVRAAGKDTLIKLISALRYIDYPYKIIGAGSNLLVRDDGFDGVMIKLTDKEITDNDRFVYASAGAPLSAVAAFARKKGLGGLEWSVGIPGTVGGAVFMNAGAFGAAVADTAAMVDILKDGKVTTLDARACRFAYRASIFQKHPDWIILGAYFFLKKADPTAILEKEREALQKRKASQPHEPSAGSVFRRPSAFENKLPASESFPLGKSFLPAKENLQSEKVSSHEKNLSCGQDLPTGKNLPSEKYLLSVGEMVEALGLKGTRIGGAQISPKHGGFIVNTGGATFADVTALISLIKKEVRKKYRVRLETEIEIFPHK